MLNILAYNNPVKIDDTDWYRLRLFNYFRAALALLFITVYLNGWLQQLVPADRIQPVLFIITALLYLASTIIFIAGISRRQPSLNVQVIIQTMVDISVIVLLMHAAGGIQTGLGMLLIITTSMTSIFLNQRFTLLFAAIATLAILGDQVISRILETGFTPAFTQASMLGALIFTSALLTTYITSHLRVSEKLAHDKNQELKSVVQMNEHIIRSMRTGIMVVNNNGSILLSNNAAAELLGIDQIKRYTLLNKISPLLYQRYDEWINHHIQNHQSITQPHGLPDIQPGFSQINQNPDSSQRTLIFLDDATQLAQRFQQVKLASLGRLTASIAHEIRNPLAAINHAGQLLGESSRDPTDSKLTRIINTQTKRLNGIVENVLQLSRQQQGNIETIILRDWLQKFREEFYRTQGIQRSQMLIEIQPDSLTILFDPTQLHQVLWNLCSNAINHSGMTTDAIIIRIQGGQDTDLAQPFIDIIDNGSGIDKQTQAHIFEPFFTTHTDGTGLGLYITREVIENNRAKIRYIHLPAGGTCFRIYFLEATQTTLAHVSP